MEWEKRRYGDTADGDEVWIFHFSNNRGTKFSAISYGATLVSVQTPDRQGVSGEITLGFDDLEGYLGPHPYFGSTAGRYANRIGGARFELDGTEYELAANDGPNHLHGGVVGFNRKIWNGESFVESGSAGIHFTLSSPDGDEGYPGYLQVSVTYCLNEDNELFINYRCESEKPTPVNLTNHTYWNLNAPGRDVRDHVLKLSSERRLSIDKSLIPNGDLVEIESTPYDFRKPKPLRDDFEEAGGYDDCFVVEGEPGVMRPAAEISDHTSGRTMVVETTQPAIQLYTSNMLTDTPGRGGIMFRQYGAFCLETGGYNNAVNIPQFPSTILRPGETYEHSTLHRFATP